MTSLSTELDRLLGPDYLEDVSSKPIEWVREKRAECDAAETAVSYLRRVAQGRLDIVHAYLDHREDETSAPDLSALVDDLSAIIASGPPRPNGRGRLLTPLAPDMEREDLTADLDAILDANRIGELPSMSSDELQEIADRLTAMERKISQQRRALHERIDRLQAEIVSRYKTGRASVDGLLT
ncbi:MAG TPA: hypothetical protein VEJ87_05805 [Acidimicrobiales bacterium]|nr:hypothetical protein [Acidimicrobiales bacterium]